jgi:uncharacterized protein (DUF58 family)
VTKAQDSDFEVTGTRTKREGVLTTRGRAFLAAGLTLLIGGLLLGFTDITRVGVLLSALPGMAGVRARRKTKSIEVTRRVQPNHLVLGQSAKVTVVLKNVSGRRTQLQLAEERAYDLLGDQVHFILPAMEPGAVREVGYQVTCQTRGRHQLGPLTLRRGDPYGLATVTSSPPGVTDILVLPRVEALGDGHPHASAAGGEGTIPHMVALHGEDDVAVRSYRDGDDLRRIHWPTTAHRSKLMVRQEDHPARRRAVIVLDSRAAGHQGSGTKGSFEWAVTAAASIATDLVQHHYALHLATSETAAAGRATQTVEIDNALACLALARLGPPKEFDDVLRWAHPLTSTGGLVIAVVTDHDEDVLERTTALRQPQGTGLMILLDTASFARQQPGTPTDRTLALADMISGAGWGVSVVGSDMTVAQAWKSASAPSALGVKR